MILFCCFVGDKESSGQTGIENDGKIILLTEERDGTFASVYQGGTYDELKRVRYFLIEYLANVRKSSNWRD